MLQTTTMPLSKGSLHSCTFKRIPDETRFHVVDPNVIQKVESSGKYILTYKEPDTTYLNIHELRKEMGSPNLDLCTEEIEEIPYLVSLSDRKIPITFFRIPNKEKQSAIVFIHGGGYIGGSTLVLQNQCRFLAEQSGATVISIDYRLAPEAPFPAAFDDCKDVVKWLVHHADHWNIDPNNLSIAGESAGGALAVSCGLSEVGKYLKLVIPIYGALDVCSASDLDYWDYDLYDVIPEHKKYVITRLNRFRNLNGTLQNLYLNDISDAKNPMASPLYATDLSNLSNVLMIEAEYDYFRLSNNLFAEHLWNADIPCEVIRYQGMDHGFYDRLGYCEQTKDCILEIAKHIK